MVMPTSPASGGVAAVASAEWEAAAAASIGGMYRRTSGPTSAANAPTATLAQ